MLKNEDISALKLNRKSVVGFKGASALAYPESGFILNSRNVRCENGRIINSPARKKLRSVQNGGGIGVNGALYWVENRRLYYGGYPVDGLYLSEGEKKFVNIGDILLIFPDAVYVSLSDTSDFGSLCDTLKSAGNTEITNCTAELSPITSYSVTDKESENAVSGDFWMKASENGYKMMRFDGYNWFETETLLRLKLSSSAECFKIGDVVEIDGIDKSCLKSSKISYILGECIYLKGCTMLNEVGPVTVRRYVPELEHAAFCGGRLCGCSSGVDSSGRYVNRFFASAQGAPFDFSDGGAYVDIPASGEILSVCDCDGVPLVFTESAIFEINIGINRTNCLEIIGANLEVGAESSIAQLGGALYFKGGDKIFCYSGGRTRSVSDCLGSLKTPGSGSFGIIFGGKYYVNAIQDDENVLISYDTSLGTFSVSDAPEILGLAVRQNVLYALVKGYGGEDEIWILDAENASEEAISYCSDGEPREFETLPWRFESAVFGYEELKGIYPEFISVRVEKCEGEALVGVACDFDEKPICSVYIPKKHGVYTFAIKAKRCDTARLSFFGKGNISVLGFMLGYTTESEGRAWK